MDCNTIEKEKWSSEKPLECFFGRSQKPKKVIGPKKDVSFSKLNNYEYVSYFTWLKCEYVIYILF